jgi:hypothetical protein
MGSATTCHPAGVKQAGRQWVTNTSLLPHIICVLLHVVGAAVGIVLGAVLVIAASTDDKVRENSVRQLRLARITDSQAVKVRHTGKKQERGSPEVPDLNSPNLALQRHLCAQGHEAGGKHRLSRWQRGGLAIKPWRLACRHLVLRINPEAESKAGFLTSTYL